MHAAPAKRLTCTHLNITHSKPCVEGDVNARGYLVINPIWCLSGRGAAVSPDTPPPPLQSRTGESLVGSKVPTDHYFHGFKFHHPCPVVHGPSCWLHPLPEPNRQAGSWVALSTMSRSPPSPLSDATLASEMRDIGESHRGSWIVVDRYEFVWRYLDLPNNAHLLRRMGA